MPLGLLSPAVAGDFLPLLLMVQRGEPHATSILADWLEERGHERAAAVRAAENRPGEVLRELFPDPNRDPILERLAFLAVGEPFPGEGQHAGDVWSGNGLGMVFCWCPPGSFRMGSPPDEEGRLEDEGPVDVTLSRGFWLGKTTVTERPWRRVMGTEPWREDDFVPEGSDYPATYVRWTDATAFAAKLTAAERVAGRLPSGWEYALPTEAQWEYACRAGTTTRYSCGDDEARLSLYAWYDDEAYSAEEEPTREVGWKLPNPRGFHDIHGHVWEWCADGWSDELPGGRDPSAATEGRPGRVYRGGSWFDIAKHARSASPSANTEDHRSYWVGFRMALVPRGSH